MGRRPSARGTARGARPPNVTARGARPPQILVLLTLLLAKLSHSFVRETALGGLHRLYRLQIHSYEFSQFNLSTWSVRDSQAATNNKLHSCARVKRGPLLSESELL